MDKSVMPPISPKAVSEEVMGGGREREERMGRSKKYERLLKMNRDKKILPYLRVDFAFLGGFSEKKQNKLSRTGPLLFVYDLRIQLSSDKRSDCVCLAALLLPLPNPRPHLDTPPNVLQLLEISPAWTIMVIIVGI